MKSNERIILHCDANNFFASVETAQNPKLKNMAVAVTGAPEKRTGIILAKNSLAKKFGVSTGETIHEAKVKCPNLVCLPPHYDLYEKYSKKLKEIYFSYTNKVEPFGIDECWLDITDSVHLFKNAENVAYEIRKKVKQQLGITVSVGISFCKLFAKLASDMKKPDATTIISKKDYKNIIYPLPIESIIGIGWRMQKQFNKFNVFTLGDLVNIPENILIKKFGVVGSYLKQALIGNDNDEVNEIIPIPKSVGNGTTMTKDIFTFEEIKEVVIFLCEKISKRLQQQKLFCSCISVAIKDINLKTVGCEKNFGFTTNSFSELVEQSTKLVKSFWTFDEKVRSIRISARNLSQTYYKQTTLFDNYQKDFEKKIALDKAINQIRTKYDKTAIDIGAVIQSDFLNKDK